VQSLRIELPSELACAYCGGELTAQAEDLRCAQHGAVGAFAGRGFAFDHGTDYWGELPREAMRTLNQDAARLGWQAAVDQHVREPELVRYIRDPTRSDWQWLLPLDRGRTVAMDVGAGLGANSFALAPHVRRVYAVEKIAERIEFIALRAAQDEAPVIPVRADFHALPFAPRSLDLVVVNGVLEWAGLRDPAGGHASPRALQERFLRRLRALLRPGGILYVGIENRWGEMFWRGVADHQGLRYTSLMPRPLARCYTFLRAAAAPRTYQRERDYRTYTYSLAGTRRLLEQCGFAAVQVWSVAPGYNVPNQIVPLEDSTAMRWFAGRVRPHGGLRARVRAAARAGLAHTGLAAQTASCFALVGRRPEEPE
jgi:SAM-dependent methyltransferase